MLMSIIFLDTTCNKFLIAARELIALDHNNNNNNNNNNLRCMYNTRMRARSNARFGVSLHSAQIKIRA